MSASARFLQETVVVGPFQCNCRLLACPVTGEAALIDPGDEPERILELLARARQTLAGQGAPVLQLRWLLHTHAHLDHIAGTRGVREALGSGEIALHAADGDLYQALRTQGELFGLQLDDPLPVEHYLEDGETLRVGAARLEVLHTPGHSPGGVCLRLAEDSEAGLSETLFTGDTLFRGSIGRTDLWGGDLDTLLGSIRERIFPLDDDTRVLSGHGPDSTVGTERRGNPFLS